MLCRFWCELSLVCVRVFNRTNIHVKKKEMQTDAGFRRTQKCVFKLNSIISFNSNTSTALHLILNFVENRVMSHLTGTYRKIKF
jgi:hypothetical protein